MQNLVVSTEIRGELIRAYAARQKYPVSELAGSEPGSLYYAYVPATKTYWAKASYDQVSGAPLKVIVSLQDGGEIGLFKKTGSGPWQVSLAGEPVFCGEEHFFPRAVLEAWSIPPDPPAPSDCSYFHG